MYKISRPSIIHTTLLGTADEMGESAGKMLPT